MTTKEELKKEFVSITDWPDKGAIADWWLSMVEQAREEGYEDAQKKYCDLANKEALFCDNHAAQAISAYQSELVSKIEDKRAEEYTAPQSNLGGAAHNAGYNLALSHVIAIIKDKKEK